MQFGILNGQDFKDIEFRKFISNRGQAFGAREFPVECQLLGFESESVPCPRHLEAFFNNETSGLAI